MGRITYGTGITKQNVRLFGHSPEEVTDGLERVAARRGFNGKISDVEQLVNTILSDPSCALIQPHNGRMGEETCETYASEISKRIRMVRADIARGDADSAARWATELGYFCCEFALKLEYERPAIMGQAMLTKLKQGREIANGSLIDRQRRWQKHRDAFDAARADGLSKMEAYEKAASQCGVSSKTIQRSVRRQNY